LRRSSPLFNPQDAGTEGFIDISVDHAVTSEADEAYVVIAVSANYDSYGNPIPVPGEDRAEVTAELTEVGIAQEDIEFGFQPYGPNTISAKVPVEQLPQVGNLVLDAVHGILGRSDSHGVRFGLSPAKCDQALALARRQAVAQAAKISNDLAQVVGLQRGGAKGVLEYPFYGFSYGPESSLNRCSSESTDPYGGLALEPFDAKPEREVGVSLHVTYVTAEPIAEPPAQP
jgi:hypothetical protein